MRKLSGVQAAGRRCALHIRPNMGLLRLESFTHVATPTENHPAVGRCCAATRREVCFCAYATPSLSSPPRTQFLAHCPNKLLCCQPATQCFTLSRRVAAIMFYPCCLLEPVCCLLPIFLDLATKVFPSD
jgi:hypothetical protein